jgi:hypothetical protein
VNDASQEHVTSIHRFEEQVKEEISMKPVASRALVSFLSFPSTLNMEVTSFFESTVDFQRTGQIITQKTELFMTIVVRASDPCSVTLTDVLVFS